MQTVSIVWEKIIDITATLIVALGFFSQPVPTVDPTAHRVVDVQVAPAPEPPAVAPKKALSETDSREVPGKVDDSGFYIGPEECRGAIDTKVALTPSGAGGLYTKEDAIIVAKQHCYFDGYGEGNIPSKISAKVASSTGTGTAWFFREIDHHPTTRQICPNIHGGITPVRTWHFELNQNTGRLVVTEGCAGVIFD